MFNKATSIEAGRERPRCRLGSPAPTSWSSAWAPPAAWPCCRWPRRASTSSASRPGTWLTGKDFAPDEIRNNVRDWPMAVQKCNREVPTHRVERARRRRRARAGHVMMNGVGGTTLHYWAQSWRLTPWDFKVVSETTRRYGALARARRVHRGGLAVRLRRARAVLRQASSTRSASRARPATSSAPSTGAATSSRRRAAAPIRCRRCAAPATSIA